MQAVSRKTLCLHSLVFFLVFSPSKQTPEEGSYCGKIKIRQPFSLSNPNSSFANIITCRSEKLYFRTSIGAFHVSSIDYTTKTLTISHSSCSSSRNFISPSLLSSGFPPPPQPNSVLLFSCSKTNHTNTIGARVCTRSPSCGSPASSCLVVDEIGSGEVGFHPKDLGCTNYWRVHKYSSGEKVKSGTRVSFDIPDHLPDVCSECKKPNGNCGVGLRCLCHAKECKDKVINVGAKSQAAFGSMQVLLLVLFLVS
ncbi:PREDICTED: uncharacterized protein LOC104814803 [Tarenaya hassleriana]|uniref:uncharacterized protein LOC104814803 n=1 Tax=Tarenaya hassleriana TaxID=28532 RepID=UPI00053C9F2A|nr:PREDICTED: uncharacterized protein LOC104814803 [Tarenaya hassleriana]